MMWKYKGEERAQAGRNRSRLPDGNRRLSRAEFRRAASSI